MPSLFDFPLPGLESGVIDVKSLAPKATLVVNVASRCGLTPQYKTLESLWRANRQRGLLIIGVPCNQFADQEPGTPEQIANFCSREYAVTFPLTEKLDVNGKNRHPLYQWLAGTLAPFPGDISWNFEKFLIDAEGQITARFSPRTAPDAPELISALSDLLAG